MPSGRRIVADMTEIGEQAKPPFAVLPDPSSLFLSRVERLNALAPGHHLESYLEFLAAVARAQHDTLSDLPPASLPPAERIAQTATHGMPPLSRSTLALDGATLATVERFLALLGEASLPEKASDAVSGLREVLRSSGRETMIAALEDASPPDDVAQRVLVLAGLQVHLTRFAAMLDASALQPVANGVCPACGGAPLASTIVGWPRAYNTRYCTCGLCGTMWNAIRATCVLCGATDGVSFREIEGQPNTIRAETCAGCRSYVKVFYQVKDVALEPLSDDVASVGLDMLLAEEGWKRGARNPFLVGY